MNELRHNIITRDWVIIATDRAHRPDEFNQHRPAPAELSPYCRHSDYSLSTALTHPGGERLSLPFHIWIFPRRHVSSFEDILDYEIDDLSQILQTVLAKLYVGLNNPDYNYTIGI